MLQTPTSPAWSRVKTSAKIRNQHLNEINAFNNQDKVLDLKGFISDISQHDFQCALIVSTVSEKIYLQSHELLQDTGIFKCMLKIKQDFSFQAYHSGIKCTFASLSQNRITPITRWSQLEEAVRFLKSFTSSQKQNILHKQAAKMGFKSVAERKYSNAKIVRAFC